MRTRSIYSLSHKQPLADQRRDIKRLRASITTFRASKGRAFDITEEVTLRQSCERLGLRWPSPCTSEALDKLLTDLAALDGLALARQRLRR